MKTIGECYYCGAPERRWAWQLGSLSLRVWAPDPCREACQPYVEESERRWAWALGWNCGMEPVATTTGTSWPATDSANDSGEPQP